ncbi:MAG: hypothetical protein HY329_11330 [Chloroflexi bacterium]|nr:hypothetical protein [Chloroflexota bacterium]
MKLLTRLTELYVVVLVAALAASLIAILTYLQRIGGVLGEVRAALVLVSDRTQPLAGHLGGVHDTAAGVATSLADVRARLERTGGALGELFGPTGKKA